MKKYLVRSPWRNRVLAEIEAADTLKLRRECRNLIGLRRSARLRYRQIGANSFLIETRRGWPVMQVHLQ